MEVIASLNTDYIWQVQYMIKSTTYNMAEDVMCDKILWYITYNMTKVLG